MEGLNRTKRIFILLVGLGILCTYFIYDFHPRNGHLVRTTTGRTDSRVFDTRFPERSANSFDSTTTTTSLTPQTTTKIPIVSGKQTLNVRRIKETENLSSSSGYSGRDNDLEAFEKKSNTEGVDRADKPRSREFGGNFITEAASENDNNDLLQKSSNGSVESDKNRKRRLPNAIIIGVKKGGTRALLEILKIHPDVQACNPEVHFFDREHNYKRGLEWYRAQMPISLPHEITIEKSPAYFVTKSVPERIQRMSKSVKLLVVVRDPTRRAISDYTQSLVKKPFIASFESFAVTDLKKRKVKESWRKLQTGLYDVHLTRWLKYFPIEQIHFISGEELIKNPATEIKRVEKFLNLKPFITEENFFFNETKGFYCLLGKISPSGPKPKPNCMGKTKGRVHPSVNGEVLKLLHDYYRPHNLNFNKMVERDFGWP